MSTRDMRNEPSIKYILREIPRRKRRHSNPHRKRNDEKNEKINAGVCVSMVATNSAFRSYWNLNRSCFINEVASYEYRQYCDWGRAFTRPKSILMPKANDSQRFLIVDGIVRNATSVGVRRIGWNFWNVGVIYHSNNITVFVAVE